MGPGFDCGPVSGEEGRGVGVGGVGVEGGNYDDTWQLWGCVLSTDADRSLQGAVQL